MKNISLVMLVFLFAVMAMLLLSPVALAKSGSGSDGTDDSDERSDSDRALADDDDSDSSGSDEDDEDMDDDSDTDRDDDEDEDDDSDDDRRLGIRSEYRERDGESRMRYEERRMIRGADGVERYVRVEVERRIKDGETRERVKYYTDSGKAIDIRSEFEFEDENGSELRLRVRDKLHTLNITPEEALALARERLELRENHTLDIREEVHKNVPRVVYHIEANKTGRFLGIWKMRYAYEGSLDAETGEVLRRNAPWWSAFLFGDEELPLSRWDDEDNEDTGNGNETDMDDDSNETDMNDTLVPTVTFNLTGENYAFFLDGEEAPTLEVTEGDVVEIEFMSAGGYHDWVVDEFDAATDQVSENETTSVIFTADQVGTFEYYCSVGSHRENGMVGNLTVVSA